MTPTAGVIETALRLVQRPSLRERLTWELERIEADLAEWDVWLGGRDLSEVTLTEREYAELHRLYCDRDALTHRLLVAERGWKRCRDLACDLCGKSGEEWR